MPTAVSIEHLSYAYPAQAGEAEAPWVLHNVSLTVEEGEFLSIMGPSGSGKSTLCLALNGIVPQSTGGVISGEVTVLGLNTKQHPVAELSQHVGLVFQDPETQLISSTVESEIAFGLETRGLPEGEIRQRLAWALELMGLKELRSRSPLEMSGGEKQRLALASILAMRPRVLVLDEPTSSLDSIGKRELVEAMRSLRDKHSLTTILVEQDSAMVAELSDRVAVLQSGVIDAVGSPQELLSDVEYLQGVGVAAPQVSEVADLLDREYGTGLSFIQLDQAVAALREELNAG